MSGKTYQDYVDDAAALGFSCDALADAAALSRGYLERACGLGKVPNFTADLALNLALMGLKMKRDEIASEMADAQSKINFHSFGL